MYPKKKVTPVGWAAAVLLALGVAGYLVPEEPQKVPVRIVMENPGGKVIFTHAAHHREYGASCESCHHEGGNLERKAVPCGSCHPAAFDRAYVMSHVDAFPDKSACVTCHHLEFEKYQFNHGEHAQFAGDDCQACHHGQDIESEPAACGDCHGETPDGDAPSLVNAAHARCGSCHQDMFDVGLKSCGVCHRKKDMSAYQGDYTACNQCHDVNHKDLVLTRTSAYHDQCMSCHEREGKGPFGEKDCNKCHIR